MKATLQPITLREAAKQIGVSYHRLQYAIITGKIEARTLGREKYFMPEDLTELREHFAAKTNGEPMTKRETSEAMMEQMDWYAFKDGDTPSESQLRRVAKKTYAEILEQHPGAAPDKVLALWEAGDRS